MPVETRLQIRIDEKTKKAAELAAKRDGADNVSAWIRTLIRARLMKLSKKAKR